MPLHLLQSYGARSEEVTHDGIVEDIDQHQQVQKAGDPTHDVGEAVKKTFDFIQHICSVQRKWAPELAREPIVHDQRLSFK